MIEVRKYKIIATRTIRNVWRNAALVTVMAMIAASALMFLMYPFELAYRLRYSTALIAGLVAGPPSLYFSFVMLENYRLTKRLRDMVQRDQLTNVSTRDHFFYSMNANPQVVGVSLMIDIDHFKRVNDTHGHIVGDTVIQMVAALLKSECRAHDLVCRFGGEEFVLFLQSADREQGWMAAERMRKRVEDAILDAGHTTIAVTISIGGSLKGPADDIVSVMSEADAALYRAKAMGRNRTITTWREDRAEHLAAASNS